MVNIVNTGVTLQGRPVGYHPQTGKIITNKFEVIDPSNNVAKLQDREVGYICPDISKPNYVWILSRRSEVSNYTHIYVYDLETNELITMTNTEDLVWTYDNSSPIFIFNDWGEKYYLLPLNTRRGRCSIWGYSTLRYARIAVYWGYHEMHRWAWEGGLNPGCVGIAGAAVKRKELYLIGSALYASYPYIKVLKTDIIHYLGFGTWFSHMFEEVFTGPKASEVYHFVWSPIIFFEGDYLYHTYVNVTGTSYDLMLRRIAPDGTVTEVKICSYPKNYTIVTYWRRCAKNKILLVVYHGDVSQGKGEYGGSPIDLQLFVIDLSILSVTDLGVVATDINGGNEYGFLDSDNVFHRIQLTEEYIIKLYRESSTRVKVVTTKLDGSPVSLTLNVYRCDGWMDTYRGGNRKELVGTVKTGSDGVGYFEYDGELTLLHFEWTRDDEGYAYNYVVVGKPKYRALKYGLEDWYVA